MSTRVGSILVGTVRWVLDGDTFELEVLEPEQRREHVRVAGKELPEKGTFAERLAAYRLRNQLLGRTVRCIVQGRDARGRLLCEVSGQAPSAAT